MKSFVSSSFLARASLYGIALLSGIAGLGYQITWARMFAVGLGHELPSVLALVTAFFAGLALGSWLLDTPLARSRRAADWYIGLELVIAGWVMVTIWMIPLLNGLAHDWIGTDPSGLWHWGVAFLLPMVGLLPATLAMGATLPAMDRFAANWISDRRIVGGLYGANTLGAVLGTLLSAFFINQFFGYSRSLMMFALLNVVCAGIVWLFFRKACNPAAEMAAGEKLELEMSTGSGRLQDYPQDHSPELATIIPIALCTGLLGIGFEVVGVRALSSIFANTVYTYAATLSVFLLGTAGGGFIYQSILRRFSFQRLLFWSLLLTSLACLIGLLLLDDARAWYRTVRQATGSVMMAEMAVSGLVFGWPSLMMGITFSHLAQSARHRSGGVGQVMAVNTVGAALAPIVFGLVLIPELGLKWCLLLVAGGYVLLIPDWQRWRWLIPLGLLVSIGIAFQVRMDMTLARNQDVVLTEKVGVMATVAVAQTAQGHRGLRVNNHYIMGGTTNLAFERIQGVLPMLLHPNPRQMLFLGVGTGITAAAATIDEQVHVTAVELVPEIVDVLPFFEPYNFAPRRNPQIEIYISDARRFVRANEQNFDVIVGDLFHPGRDGAGSLYTVEHFAAIRDRLKPEGVACIWLPSYQMDSEVLQIVIRSYLEVFPNAVALLGKFQIDHLAIALVSDVRHLQEKEDYWETRLAGRNLTESLNAIGIQRPEQLLGRVLADNQTLRQYAGTGQLNTDDLPLVTYLAPRYMQAGYPRRWQRYRDLNELFRPIRSEFRSEFYSGLPESSQLSLEQFWLARDLYLEAMTMQHSDKTDRLLQALAADPNFDEAYQESLTVAELMLAERLPRQAKAWLTKVIAVRAETQKAQRLLESISDQ